MVTDDDLKLFSKKKKGRPIRNADLSRERVCDCPDYFGGPGKQLQLNQPSFGLSSRQQIAIYCE
jgi:hypothetical protein